VVFEATFSSCLAGESRVALGTEGGWRGTGRSGVLLKSAEIDGVPSFVTVN